MNSNLVLHTAIHQAIEKHGQEILSDLRLMYILSDYGAFDKLSDDHDILKALQTNGYGQLLLDCKNNQDAKWQLKVIDFTNDFLSANSHFDSAEVIYICDAIAYGLGLLPETAIRKNGTISPSSSSPSTSFIDYAAELQKLKNEYLALLNSSIVVPQGKLFRKPSGYFPSDAQNKLYLLEKKIWMLGHELGQDLDSWCANEKQKILEDNAHPVGPQRLGLLTVIAAPATAIVILVSTLVSFLGAKDAVSAFKTNIAHADSLFQANDYFAASEAYKQAGASYKESYKHSKYERIVESGIQKASASIVNDCMNRVQALYDKNDYLEALIVLHSIPNDVDCSFDNKLSKKLTAMEKDLTAKCDVLLNVELEGFIKDISKSKGIPSKEILTRIDYLLSVDPSNYWLNFIKNKSAGK